MEEDQDPVVVGFDVAFGILNLGFRSVGSGEEVMSHRNGNVSMGFHGVVDETNVRPRFQSKALVLLELLISTYEVAESGLEVVAEGNLGGEGGFELD